MKSCARKTQFGTTQDFKIKCWYFDVLRTICGELNIHTINTVIREKIHIKRRIHELLVQNRKVIWVRVDKSCIHYVNEELNFKHDTERFYKTLDNLAHLFLFIKNQFYF